MQLSDFFQSRATHVLQPLLRYCEYELQQQHQDDDGGSKFSSQAEIDDFIQKCHTNQDDDDKNDETGAADADTNTDADTDKDAMKVFFCGHEIFLQDGTLRMTFIRIQNKKKELLLSSTNTNTKNKGSTKDVDSKCMQLQRQKLGRYARFR